MIADLIKILKRKNFNEEEP